MRKIGSGYLVLYAIAMIVGGIAGFGKGSMVSLFAGVGSGIVLFLIHTRIKVDAPRAFQIAAGVAGLLCISMGRRYLESHKFIPSGLILGISILGVVVFIVASLAKDE